MSLSTLVRFAVLWLGWLLAADAVANLVLASFTVFDLGELLVGAFFLALSTGVHGRLAPVFGIAAIFGLARILNWVLRGLVYHEVHRFTLLGYVWRAAIFCGLGVTFLWMTRKHRLDAERAA